MDFDTAVKLNIYETIARTTQAPTSADVAKALSTSPEEVEAAIARLHKKRLLVPEPGNSSRIRMAPPFSGVETPFRVTVQDKSYYANCVWDALGIAAALTADAIIEASDGQSGEPMILEVRKHASSISRCQRPSGGMTSSTPERPALRHEKSYPRARFFLFFSAHDRSRTSFAEAARVRCWQRERIVLGRWPGMISREAKYF